MSNSDDVAIAGAGESSSSLLSDAQHAAFWAGIVANYDAARRMAAQFVRRQSVDDVVNTVALRFIESLKDPKKAKPFPKTDDAFRARFLTMVHNHAIDCVRHTVSAERPIHSHWAKEEEPTVGGRNVPDRELDEVFARNDHGEYDAPAPAERREKNNLDELYDILHSHLEGLTPTQREIIVETYIEGRKRAEVAARRGISVNTYDNHLQAARRKLRESITDVADLFTEIDVDAPPWYALIQQVCQRNAATSRGPGKKGNRSTSRGDRSNSARDRGKNSRAGA